MKRCLILVASFCIVGLAVVAADLSAGAESFSTETFVEAEFEFLDTGSGSRLHVVILGRGEALWNTGRQLTREAAVGGWVRVPEEVAQSEPSDKRWRVSLVPWSYNPTGQPEYLSATNVVNFALADASSLWSYAKMSLDYRGFTDAVSSCAGPSKRDGINAVLWATLPSGILGQTCHWTGAAGELEEFDIEMTNSTAGTWSLYGLYTLARHEFGHAIGIDHLEEALCESGNDRPIMCAGGSGRTGLSSHDLSEEVARYGGSGPKPKGVGMFINGWIADGPVPGDPVLAFGESGHACGLDSVQAGESSGQWYGLIVAPRDPPWRPQCGTEGRGVRIYFPRTHQMSDEVIEYHDGEQVQVNLSSLASRFRISLPILSADTSFHSPK